MTCYWHTKEQATAAWNNRAIPDHLATALHDAARLAQAIRAAKAMIVRGAVYGDEGRVACVTIATHTQALAQLRAVEEDNAALRARLLSPSPRRGEGRDEGESEEEFGGEVLEAADR